MASKRQMLDFEVDEEGEPEATSVEAKENLKGLVDENQAAKRVKGPLGTPLQRLLKSSGSTVLSPITELSQNMRVARLEAIGGGTPKSTQRSFHSTSSRTLSSFNSYDSGNSLDDEYMAMFELEEGEDQQLGLPGDLELLISGQLKAEQQQQQQHPEKEDSQRRSVRRCLSMFPCEDEPQVQGHGPTFAARKLQRKTLSMNDADIMTALGDEPELIGDLSKPCVLPCLLTGTRHRDLKTISCDTLARLMQGEFVEQLGTGGGYQIIDCRYPYEFVGGHIRGARNLYTRGQIEEAFPTLTHKERERRIYVFHCEFSSERGPKLLRFLRNNDRSHHASTYPTLDYPELYLLHNGYKEFYGSHADLCEPCQYVPMLSPAHNEEFRYFRAKTKSWQSGEGEGGDSGIGGGSCRPLRKSRSRLLYAEGDA